MQFAFSDEYVSDVRGRTLSTPWAISQFSYVRSKTPKYWSLWGWNYKLLEQLKSIFQAFVAHSVL
jgi:hypothetical protein